MKLSDKDFYQGLKDKDEECWLLFFRKYEDVIYYCVKRYLGKNVNQNDAENCTLKTIKFILDHIDLYSPDVCSFENWISYIIRHFVLKQKACS